MTTELNLNPTTGPAADSGISSTSSDSKKLHGMHAQKALQDDERDETTLPTTDAPSVASTAVPNGTEDDAEEDGYDPKKWEARMEQEAVTVATFVDRWRGLEKKSVQNRIELGKTIVEAESVMGHDETKTSSTSVNLVIDLQGLNTKTMRDVLAKVNQLKNNFGFRTQPSARLAKALTPKQKKQKPQKPTLEMLVGG